MNTLQIPSDSKLVIAKYAGRCKRCEEAFERGTHIRMEGRGQAYHMGCDSLTAVPKVVPVSRAALSVAPTPRLVGRRTCAYAPYCHCCPRQ